MFQALCGGEMAWVTRDWTAHTQAELSLKQGQQVELLDVLQDVAAPQLVRVRLELTEGLVPSSCLQMPPRGGQLSEGRQLHSVIIGVLERQPSVSMCVSLSVCTFYNYRQMCLSIGLESSDKYMVYEDRTEKT